MQIRVVFQASLKLAAITVLMGAFQVSHAAYLLEIDTDGLDDGPVTYNSHFSFGGDTTTASSSAASTAYGLSGADSIFGGDGLNFLDTYVYTYDPSSDADNLVIPAGTDLGGGVLASGLSGGAPATYAIYATWPFSSNVSGGPTRFDASTAGDGFVFDFDQTGGGAGTGNIWIKLGEISWTSGAITMTQMPTVQNSFVSMRAAGVLFEVVPEPSAFSLGLLGALGLMLRRLRSRK